MSSERTSDRYGSVSLHDTDSRGRKVADNAKMDVDTILEYAGKYGRLICEVLETRESAHVGDDSRKFKPSMPEIGDIIKLGEGELFHQIEEGIDNVGLIADRPSDWLDPRALYKVHEQTVNLYFEPKR